MRIERHILSCLLIISLLPSCKDANDVVKFRQARDVMWERFYCPATHLFYDYISSYEKGKELSHLPTAREVENQNPNPCGYGTGMEDCMLLTGTMLETLVDMYDTYHDTAYLDLANDAFKGIAHAALIPEAPGFVARGICVFDDSSYYVNSSRDQYTHCVYALWKFYSSPSCRESARDSIRLILKNIADRMMKNVTPENDYDFLRADNQRCPLGICRMWNVQPHEAARLPMFYAAAWKVTGDAKYHDAYRKYIYDAIEQSEQLQDSYSTYVYVQMLYSFDLLYSLEEDPSLKERLLNLKKRVSEMAFNHSLKLLSDLKGLSKDQISALGPNWRNVKTWETVKGYSIPRWGEYRKIWETIRGIGEASFVVFSANMGNIDEERKILHEYLSLIDYDHVSSCGIVYHVAAGYKDKMIMD